MSAEYDIHTETESDDGGVSLAKVESDEMDIDTGLDTTPTSQDLGESSSSASAWGQALHSPFDGFTEHGNPTAEHQHVSATFMEIFQDSMTASFSATQAATSTPSSPVSVAPHSLETGPTFIDAGFGTIEPLQYFHSTDAGSHEGWEDFTIWPVNGLSSSNGTQLQASLPLHFWSEPVVPQGSPPPPPAAQDNVTPTESSEPPAGTFEPETAQGATQDLLEDPPLSAGMDDADESDENWLHLSESYNIFNSDIAHINGTLHTLSQASNMVSYLDQDDLEDENSFFSVASFLYQWKQMYTNGKPDYPGISQLANDIRKVRRPDKITTNEVEQCDYQGIHWSWLQTTKQEAREVRRMTYRNLRSVGLSEENYGTKAFKANFPGAVIPDSDCYFKFKEMDMNRRPDYSHFQLRHNLSATSKNSVFYTQKPLRVDTVPISETYKLWHKTITCFNPETGTELCAMDLSNRYTKLDPKITKIHTLTAGNGVLVAGSFEGVYAMKSLSANFESAPLVGSIATGNDVSTNHIHTHLDRQSGMPRVVFDSNDRSVRILDCTTNVWVACHKYPYQVNCSSTSPDGRLRLLNGDDCEPIVANAETGETLAKLQGHSDYGFACDWAPDGITMATGHQDGLVKVWDARKLNQSMQTIAMEQAGCRSLQFSPLGSGKRVLVLAEPADFVHIVDAQSFESRQTIDFFGEISGVSMPPDGSKLYIANADSKYGGLMEFERSSDSGKYNRRPFRVADLEAEHEGLVDSIVDGMGPAQHFPNIGDRVEQHVEPFMHGQGLPFVASLMIEEKIIDCQRLFSECLNKGGGQEVTISGGWSTLAGTFSIPRGQAVPFGQQLYEYWQDNLAPYETFLASQTESGNGTLKPRTLLHSGEERQYCRDYNDPRRKGFKVGRKSESLDWLSESDMEDDARLNIPEGPRRRQWTSPLAEVDDNFLTI